MSNALVHKDIDRAFRAAAFNFVIYAITSISFSISLVRIKQELGLNLTQVASFTMISSIEQAIILLLTPLFTSKFPKVNVLISFAFSFSYYIALISILFMGFATALQEALLTPIVGDLYPNEINSKMNIMHGFWPLGICASLLLIGYLLSIGVSWRYVYLSISFLAFLNFWFYPRAKNVPFNSTKFDIKAAKKIFISPAFWYFGLALFFVGGAEGAFSFWSATFIQLNLKTSVFMAGVITSFF